MYCVLCTIYCVRTVPYRTVLYLLTAVPVVGMLRPATYGYNAVLPAVVRSREGETKGKEKAVG